MILSGEYIRYLPRYIKAEERRWQRLLARGGEPPAIGRELVEWRERAGSLRAQAQAELRYRRSSRNSRVDRGVSSLALCAGAATPVPCPRHACARARAAIEAWLTR